MESKHQTRPSKVDDHLTVLADQTRRAILYHFRDASAEVAALDDLVSYLLERNGGDAERITTRLHHSTLPQLADAGVLEYQRSAGTVRYLGDRELERLLASVAEYERDFSQRGSNSPQRH